MKKSSEYLQSMFKKLCGTALFSATVLLSTSCGPGESNPLRKEAQSSVDSVEIPQTPVENQNRVGFCWAYAVIGLVESDYKFRTGEALQLSEEAMGFYRMVEGLYYLTQNLRGQELSDNIMQDTFQGWLLKSDEIPDSFDLLKTYGVVPESVWKVKFESEESIDGLVKVIRRAMNRLVFNTIDPRTITRAQIIEKVLLAPGAWQSAPPQEFSLKGIKYTPQSYLDSLEFDPMAFESVVTNRPEDVEKVIRATKRALVRGISVPLGFPVNFDRLKADTFTGKGVDLKNGENFFRDGGHAVLIDDWVNKGSVPGALPLQQIVQEFLRPTLDLDYLVFKNSWGTDAKMNEAGVVVSGSPTGYYKMDREYLVGSANMSASPEFQGMLEVVVPADIALNPFGDEPVNPEVSER